MTWWTLAKRFGGIFCKQNEVWDIFSYGQRSNPVTYIDRVRLKNHLVQIPQVIIPFIFLPFLLKQQILTHYIVDTPHVRVKQEEENWTNNYTLMKIGYPNGIFIAICHNDH